MLTATMVVATVPVSDLEQAKHFYGEILGLTQLWENPASVRYRCGEHSELSVFKRRALDTVHTFAHSRSTTSKPPLQTSKPRKSPSSTTPMDANHYGPHCPDWPRTRRMVRRPRRQYSRHAAGVALRRRVSVAT